MLVAGFGEQRLHCPVRTVCPRLRRGWLGMLCWLGVPWPGLLWFGLFGMLPLSGQSTTGDTVYTVHGSVVNGKTGAPLARALVTSADRRLATMTDAEGRFVLRVSVPATQAAAPEIPGSGSFVPSPPGALLLMAQKPGFLMERGASLLRINDSLNTTEQTLKIMPEAVVQGRVSASGIEEAAGVRVQLFLRQAREGSFLWQPLGSRQTDSEGRFRFGDLLPGEYTVMTGAWRGEQPPSRGDVAIHEQYPVVFLGESHDLASAAKLHLHFGDAVREELHLEQTVFHPVMIPVSTEGGHVGVNARLAGPMGADGYPMHYNQRDGAVEGELPDGDYQVLVSAAGATQGSAVVPVHVAGRPVQTAAATFSPASSIAVHVRFELDANQKTRLPTLQLWLQSADFSTGGAGGVTRPEAEADAQKNFTLNDVQPGTYNVSAHESQGYVAAMSCGGVDLLQHPLVVGPSGVRDPIQVTVRDDGGQLSGKVTAEGLLPSGVSVVVLPLGGASQFHFTFPAADGSFEIKDVAPGTYRVLAGMGFPWQIAYKDEAIMRSLEGKGSVITIDPGGKQTANPSLIGSFDDLVP